MIRTTTSPGPKSSQNHRPYSAQQEKERAPSLNRRKSLTTWHAHDNNHKQWAVGNCQRPCYHPCPSSVNSSCMTGRRVGPIWVTSQPRDWIPGIPFENSNDIENGGNARKLRLSLSLSLSLVSSPNKVYPKSIQMIQPNWNGTEPSK